MTSFESTAASILQQRLESSDVSIRDVAVLVQSLLPAEVAEVLQLHQMHAWSHGQREPVEAYIESMPCLAEPEFEGTLLDLIYSEIVLISDCGETPNVSEFLERFPQLGRRIENLFLIHGAIMDEMPKPGSHDATIDLPQTENTKKPADTTSEQSTQKSSLPVIPGYESLSLIGHGGMGVVIKARQIDLDRIVAIKMIRSGSLATPRDVSRFRREAQLVANLHHPNIVAVHDYGELDGHPYFTMEFVDGIPLSKWIARRTPSLKESIDLVRSLAAAIAYAHAQGVVHRDIKPSNAIVDQNGNVKLLDFGLSFNHAAAQDITTTGMILGTPAYMSNEQARGLRVTTQSDVYSLGAVLFELLTGRPPFVAETPLAILEAALRENAPSVRSINPAIPRDIETLVAKCLSKDPSDRIESASELVDELDRFNRDEPIRSRRLSIASRLIRWRRRNRIVAALLGLVFLILIAGTATSMYFAMHAQKTAVSEKGARDDAEKKSKEAEESRDAARKNERLAVENETIAKRETMAARRSLYASEMLLAQHAAETGNLQRARNLLNRAWVPPDQVDLRGVEWYLLWEFVHTQQLAFAGHVNRIIRVVYSPNGRHIASTSPSSDIIVHDAQTGMPLHRLRSPKGEAQEHLAYNHDGKYLVSGLTQIFVWNSETGNLIRSFGSKQEVKGNGLMMCCDLHPSRNWMVTGHGHTGSKGGDSELKLWDVDAGKLISRMGDRKTSDNWVYAIRFSKDGKLIASAGADRLVKIWDTESGELIQTLAGHTSHVDGVVFTDDGKVISASWDNTIRVWDLATGNCEQVLSGHQGIVRDVDLSPDGNTIVSAGGTDKLVLLWDLKTGDIIKKFAGHPSMVWQARFSPDGKHVVSAGNGLRYDNVPASTGVAGVIKTWDVERGQQAHPSLSWSSDQRRGRVRSGCLIRKQEFDPLRNELWTAFNDGHIECLDCETQRPRNEFEIPEAHPIALAIDSAHYRVATYCDDGTLRLHDATDFKQLRSIKVPERDIHESFRITFHPTEPAIVIGSFWPTRVWYFDENRITTDETLKGGTCPTFSPDGKILATGHNQELILWDWETKQPIASNGSTHKGRIQRIVFSRDGTRCATAGYNGRVVLWETKPLQPIQIFEGHVSSVADVCFSPDETRLVSCSADGTVRIWLIDLGVELLTLSSFGHELLAVNFDNSQQRLYVAVRLFYGANNTSAQTRLFQIPSEADTMEAVLNPVAVFDPQSVEEGAARVVVQRRKEQFSSD